MRTHKNYYPKIHIDDDFSDQISVVDTLLEDSDTKSVGCQVNLPNRLLTHPYDLCDYEDDVDDEDDDEYSSAYDNVVEKPKDLRERIGKVIESTVFQIIIIVLSCLDGLLVLCILLLEIEILKHEFSSKRDLLKTVQFALECSSLCIITLFLLEIPLNLAVFGPKFYRKCAELADVIICAVSFAADTYTIVQHVKHSHGHGHGNRHDASTEGHTHSADSHHPPGATEPPLIHCITPGMSMHSDALADAAGLVILFRLWRIVRIINAIIVSMSTSQHQAKSRMKKKLNMAKKRIAYLEWSLKSYKLGSPPVRPRSTTPRLKSNRSSFPSVMSHSSHSDVKNESVDRL